MSLEHKNVVRNNDEYFCTACGKSWDATDRDPPACDPVARANAPYNSGYLTPFVPDEPEEGVPVPKASHKTLLNNGGVRMTMGEAENYLKQWRDENPQITGVWTGTLPCQQFSKELWPTPADPYRELERQLVEKANAGPLTRADFGTVTAWLVDEIGDESRALLVYAPDRPSAQRYAVAVSGRTATMEVRRLSGMDKHGRGSSAYTELNPTLLKVASKMARREVVPLFTWRRQP